MDVRVDASLAKGIRKSEILDAYFLPEGASFADCYLPVHRAAHRWSDEVWRRTGSLNPVQTKAIRRVVVDAVAQNLNQGSDFLYHLGFNTMSRKRSSEEFVMAARPQREAGYFHRSIVHLFFSGRTFVASGKADVFDLSIHFFDRYLERSSETEVGQRNCIRAYEELVNMRGLFVFLAHMAPAVVTGGMRVPFRDGLLAAEIVGPQASATWRFGYTDFHSFSDRSHTTYVPPILRDGRGEQVRLRVKTFINNRVLSPAKAEYINEFNDFVHRYQVQLDNLAVFSGMFYPSFDDPMVDQVLGDVEIYEQMASDFRWMMCRDERNSQVFCKQRGIDFSKAQPISAALETLAKERALECDALRDVDRGAERDFWETRGTKITSRATFASPLSKIPFSTLASLMRETEASISTLALR